MPFAKQGGPLAAITMAIALAATGSSAAEVVFNRERLPAIGFPTSPAENWRFFPVEWQTQPLMSEPADDIDLSATLRIDASAVDEPPYDTGQYCRFASLSHFHYQAGFILRQSPDGPDCYRVQFSVADQSVAVWKAPDNFLAVAPCPIATGHPIAVAIRLRGNRIAVDVDGQQMIDVVDRIAPLNSGSVLAAANRAQATFADVNITPASTAAPPDSAAGPHVPAFAVRSWCGRRWIFDGQEPVARLAEGKDGKSWLWHPIALSEAKLRPGTRAADCIPLQFRGSGNWPEQPLEVISCSADRVVLRAHTSDRTTDREPTVRTESLVTLTYDAPRDSYVFTVDSTMTYLAERPAIIEIMDPWPYGVCGPAPGAGRGWDARYRDVVWRDHDDKLYRYPLNHFLLPTEPRLSRTAPLLAFCGDDDVNPTYEILTPSLGREFKIGLCVTMLDMHVQQVGLPAKVTAGTVQRDSWRVSSTHGPALEQLHVEPGWHPVFQPQAEARVAIFDPRGTSFAGDQVVAALAPHYAQAFVPHPWYAIDPDVGHDAPGSLRMDLQHGTHTVTVSEGLTAFGTAFDGRPRVLTLFAKAVELDGSFRVTIRLPGNRVAASPPLTGTTDGWQRIELEFAAGASDHAVAIGLEMTGTRGGKGQVWIDDASLTESTVAKVGENPRPDRTRLHAFMHDHCADCHDAASATADFVMESLPDDFSDPRWVRIHDRVAAGEMPPADASQPEPAARQAFVNAVAATVTAALQNRQAAEGRVVLRRMNRREYEHALHDLLGIALPLAMLLPEDTQLHGFDTTSRGLEMSATHLLRYQRAADAALAEALPIYPLESKTVRWSGREYLEQRHAVYRKHIDPLVRLDGDSIVLHARLQSDKSMQPPRPTVAGRYRVRAAVRPVATGGRPLTVLLGKQMDRFQVQKLMHVIGYRDLPADRTTVIEAESDLGYSQGNQFFYFEVPSLPFFQDFAKARGDRGTEPLEADFAGPGLAIEWAELEGPLEAGLAVRRMFADLPRRPRMPDGKEPPPNWTAWPSPFGQFTKYPLEAVTSDPVADATRLIRGFLPLAFRRPVTEAEGGHYAALVRDGIAAGLSFDESMRSVYKSILCSPHFLTFVERPGRLDDFAVAARLARFLWSSVPDEPLLAAAAAGRLSGPGGLRAETERMLADPRSRRFVREFTDQWIDLARFLEMMPDAVYVEVDDSLLWSIPEETRAFFARVLDEDLPVTSFLDSDWTMLNERLARHYSIDGVVGAELRKVALKPEYHRGGIITHASFLKMSTNATYTSPIKRGAWVLERLLGTPPNPPPPNIEAIEPDIRGATTIREQLALHKTAAACAGCHQVIDPPGFALENYDVIGGWRDRYRVKQGGKGIDSIELATVPGKKIFLAKPVEPGGELPDGATFSDLAGYKQLVLRHRDLIARGITEKLIVYATGAPPDFADREVVDQILADTRSSGHGLRSLVHAIIESSVFLRK